MSLWNCLPFGSFVSFVELFELKKAVEKMTFILVFIPAMSTSHAPYFFLKQTTRSLLTFKSISGLDMRIQRSTEFCWFSLASDRLLLCDAIVLFSIVGFVKSIFIL